MTPPPYSWNLAINIDGNSTTQNYLLVQTTAFSPDVRITQTNIANYKNNLRAVVSRPRNDTSSPYEVTTYFTLPRSAPANTEFVFIVIDDTTEVARSESYSIAKNCPKGN